MPACAGNEKCNVTVVVQNHVGWGSLELEPQKDVGGSPVVERAVAVLVAVGDGVAAAHGEGLD